MSALLLLAKNENKTMRMILLIVALITATGVASAQTYEEKLEKGAATTERNEMNVPFVRPDNFKTPYTAASNWPIFENRGPVDRSPADKPSKVLVLGSGDPMPNPFRFGPAMAVIVNDYPYFVDCGEGWWRALGKAALSQDALDLPSIFRLTNLKYMFLTHLHEDHTVGLPSFISNPFKFGVNGNKKVYGPEGIDEMMGHINAAYRIDRNEMFQGSIGQHGDGGTALGIPIRPSTGLEGAKIFEDDNVIVVAYPTSHGALEHTYAYRFTTKPDNRTFVFGGDGHYSKGLAEAAKGADILFVEGITRKNIEFATWGGTTVEEKVKTIGAYHMFPSDLKKLQDESGVKSIVLVHAQNYNNPDDFERLGVLKEMQNEGISNILSAQDGDLY